MGDRGKTKHQGRDREREERKTVEMREWDEQEQVEEQCKHRGTVRDTMGDIGGTKHQGRDKEHERKTVEMREYRDGGLERDDEQRRREERGIEGRR